MPRSWRILRAFRIKNVQHHLIDFVVAPPNRYDRYLGFRLAESVDPPLALFKAIWIPRQVVMHHGVETVLKVYSFAEAVGCHQHVLLMRLQSPDAFSPAHLVRIIAGNRSYFVGQQTVSEPPLEFAEQRIWRSG